MAQAITKESIKHDLRRLGLGEADSLFVHSSMKSMGFVCGGPQAVIDAFLELLGVSGTLMVPTFTFTNFQPFFDPENTPSEMGIITETLRQREDSIRSMHPRHSVSAIGQGAAELVQGHLSAGSLGVGSPLDKLSKRGGYILLSWVLDKTSIRSFIWPSLLQIFPISIRGKDLIFLILPELNAMGMRKKLPWLPLRVAVRVSKR